MKVSSPVGDFPFDPKRLEISSTGLVLHGEMGAWPATVRVDLSDVPALMALIPRPIQVALLVGGGLAALRILREIAKR
jgi:hypothetical protein